MVSQGSLVQERLSWTKSPRLFVANIVEGRQAKRFVADTLLWQNSSARKSTKSLHPLSPAFTGANNSYRDNFFSFFCKNLAPQAQLEPKLPKESLKGPKRFILHQKEVGGCREGEGSTSRTLG